MTKEKRKFFLKLENDSANLRLIREFVSGVANEAGFDEDEIYQIELAVDEACSNVVKHAYSQDKDKKEHSIELEIHFDEKEFSVKVLDRGQGFDPSQLPQTNMKSYLEKFQVGGLGIRLMKSLMDQVEYSIKPGSKNQVTLTKYRKQ